MTTEGEGSAGLLPHEITALLGGGDFAVLADDEFLKLGAFLKTYRPRLRSLAQMAADQPDHHRTIVLRLRRLHEYNSSRRAFPVRSQSNDGKNGPTPELVGSVQDVMTMSPRALYDMATEFGIVLNDATTGRRQDWWTWDRAARFTKVVIAADVRGMTSEARKMWGMILPALTAVGTPPAGSKIKGSLGEAQDAVQSLLRRLTIEVASQRQQTSDPQSAMSAIVVPPMPKEEACGGCDAVGALDMHGQKKHVLNQIASQLRAIPAMHIRRPTDAEAAAGRLLAEALRSGAFARVKHATLRTWIDERIEKGYYGSAFCSAVNWLKEYEPEWTAVASWKKTGSAAYVNNGCALLAEVIEAEIAVPDSEHILTPPVPGRLAAVAKAEALQRREENSRRQEASRQRLAALCGTREIREGIAISRRRRISEDGISFPAQALDAAPSPVKVEASSMAPAEPRTSDNVALASSKLSDTEQRIVETIGPATLTGEQIAKKAGYPFNSNFKSTLSSLRKRGILDNASPGYFVVKK